MFEFSHRDYDNKTEVNYVIDRDDITWTELTDAYIDFMRGCGFVFSEETIREYITEHLSDIVKATQK